MFSNVMVNKGLQLCTHVDIKCVCRSVLINLDNCSDGELHRLVCKVDESGYFDETHVGSDEEDEDCSQEEEEEEEVKEECEEGDESSPEEDNTESHSTLQQMAQQV